MDGTDDQSYSHNEDLEQRLEAAGNSSDYVRERGPPAGPSAGRPATQRPAPDLPCRLCERMTPRTIYDSFGGFCKERHRKEWSVVILTLPPQRLRVNINAHLSIRFARQSQRQ